MILKAHKKILRSAQDDTNPYVVILNEAKNLTVALQLINIIKYEMNGEATSSVSEKSGTFVGATFP